MASVCVKTVGTSPEKLSPASHSRKISKTSAVNQESKPLENEDPVDFEFLLEDPVTMLTADELFSDGKLVPLKFSGASNPEEKPVISTVNTAEKQPCRRLEMEIDPYLFSPRAPRCTVRWRELLGLKRLSKTPEEASPSSSSSRLSSSTPNPKTSSFRHFLNRGSKSTPSTAAAAPPPPPPPQTLIKDSDVSESSASISSSRLSLSSSSSSGHDLDDVPRLSLDLDKPNAPNPFARSRAHHHLRNQQRKPRRHDETTESGGNETRALTVTADSPRLNASGKIVFHGLERSSSSPGNFTGGPRLKQHHGMPRSQSAHVRITPVLNVPVSSLRGGPKSGLFFGQLFTSSSSASANRAQLQSNTTTKNRTNRTRLEPTSEL